MKSPGLAAVLSFFFCGLGQIYNGQIVKGLVFLAAYFLSWLMMWIVIALVEATRRGIDGGSLNNKLNTWPTRQRLKDGLTVEPDDRI